MKTRYTWEKIKNRIKDYLKDSDSPKVDNLLKNIEKMDYGFLLSLLIGFLGLWYFLYQNIVQHVSENINNHECIPYSIIHFIISVYLFSISCLTYIKGLLTVKKNILNKPIIYNLISRIYSFLYVAWLPLGILSLILICIAPLDNPAVLRTVLYTTLVIFLAIKIKWIVNNLGFFLLSFGTIVLSYGCFLIILTIASSDIIVTTDKQVYHEDESIILTLMPKSYIFHPQIKYIKSSRFDSIPVNWGTYRLPPIKTDSLSNGESFFIEIFYANQIYKKHSIKKLHVINVVE